MELIYTDPINLGECLKEIIPKVILQDAHTSMYWIADDNGDCCPQHYFHYQWQEYFRDLSYSSLTTLKKQAEIILKNSERVNPRALKNSKMILECLKGNFPKRKFYEKTPEEKAKSNFEKKRDKLRLKLTIQNGYKCADCGKDDENSLCITQKEKSMLNYELDNLMLRCRKCMNKAKTKNNK
jgi:5-methylcytosine-specific restriction endonuclease McrA